MYVEIGVLIAFGAIICWALGDFFIQKSSRKIGDLQTLFFVGLFATLFLLPFVWKDLLSLTEPRNILILAILGILTLIAGLLNFEALKEGKFSVVEIITELELPITIILSIFILKETISLKQSILIALIFLGIILIAIKSYHLKNLRKFIEKGAIIGIFGAIGMGFVNFLTATSARTISPIAAVWAPALIFSIICLALIIKRDGIKNLLTNLKRFKLFILAAGLFDTAAWTLYATSIMKQEVSIITAMTESYPSLSLFLGRWFNKERINWHQYLGAAIALISCILLGLS